MSHPAQSSLPSAERLSFELKELPGPQFTPRCGFIAWVDTLIPLVLHCALSLGTMAFMAYYVNERHFNLTNQGSVEPMPFAYRAVVGFRSILGDPSQSDITTLVSIASGFGSAITAMWAVALGWRSAFFLMERTGLEYSELDRMISYGLLIPLSYRGRFFIFPICFILLATFSARPSSPILTSSITWVPSNRLIAHEFDVSMNVSVVENADEWIMYSNVEPLRQWATNEAVGFPI